MDNRLFRLLKYILGWPFSVLAFIFILRIIIPKIPVFSSNLQQINTPLLISGVSCFILFYSVRSYIWHRLLKVYSKEITYKKASYLWALSELRRYIPGNFWGLLGRTLNFSKVGIGKKEVGKLVVLEAGIFMAGSILFSLVSFPFVAKYIFPQLNSFPRLIIGLLVATLISIYVYNHKIFRFLPKFSVYENIHLLFLTILSVLFFGLGSYFTINSFVALPLQLIFQLSSFFVLSLLLGFSSLLTPAGFGVREGITISGLSKIIPVSLAAFAALFARVTLIISELIFILIALIWYKTKNKKFLSIEKWIANNKHEAVLIFLILVYIIYFTLTTFLRFDNFYTGRFDLGNMAQTVWNTTQGRVFEFSNPHGDGIISRLAFHADFLLILFAPLYAIFPTPKTLLFIQTVVVSLGAGFVYLIAKDKLKNKSLGLVFAFSYLLNPSVQRANLYDFHSVTLATTFLLSMYYFYNKKQYIYFLVFAILAAISKEQIWLIVALFGAMIFIWHKMRLFGSVLFVSSVAMFYYLVMVAIPSTAGSAHFALSYYSEFGDGPLSILKTIILSPQTVTNLLLEKSRIDYLVQIFSPTGYLAFLFPFFLFFATPDFLINLLSNNAQLHQIYYHYTAAITPFIFISSIYATGLIKNMLGKKYNVLLVVFVIATALIGAYKYGPLPGALEPNLDMFTKKVQDKQFIDDQLKSIPAEASVAASNNIGSHLSDRKILHTLPLGIDSAQVVIFFLNKSEQPESLVSQRIQLLNLRNNPNFEVIAEKGEFIMFRRKY